MKRYSIDVPSCRADKMVRNSTSHLDYLFPYRKESIIIYIIKTQLLFVCVCVCVFVCPDCIKEMEV